MKKLIIVITSILMLFTTLFFRQPAEGVSPPEPEGSISSQTAEVIPRVRMDIVSTDSMSDAAENQPFYTDSLDTITITEPKKSDSSVIPTENHSEHTEKQTPGYRVIHHEAEYKTIHHDAVTIHHDAEYKTIHHEAEGHFEEVVATPAWDEAVSKEKTEQHIFCNESSCHMDFTAAGLSSSQIWDHLEEHALKGEASGHHTEDIKTTVTETVHHEAETKQVWITDKEAWDEKILIKEAWDEVKPAYDERILVKEAWDEKVPG